MRILLVRPAFTTELNMISQFAYPPLSLMYLSAVARKEHEVRVLDSPMEAPRTYRVHPWGVNRMVGCTPTQIAERAAAWQADVVGVTCEFSQQIVDIEDLSVRLRERLPRARLVLGGGYPTVFAQSLLERAVGDAVVLSEGETSFAHLLRAYDGGTGLDGVRGIAFRDSNGLIVHTPAEELIDLDNLPFPARDVIDQEAYLRQGLVVIFTARRRTANIMTSRGCPYRCSFCYSTAHWRHTYRVQSPERSLAEIADLLGRYRIEELHIIDDHFFANRPVAEQVLEGIARLMKPPRYAFPLGVAVRSIDAPLADLLARTGCHHLVIAVESASQEVLDQAAKPVQIQEVKDKVGLLQQRGITVEAYFMIGFPNEPRASVLATARLARELPVRMASLFSVTPFPGTPIYREFAKLSGFNPETSCLNHDYFEPHYSVCELPSTELYRILNAHRLHTLLKLLRRRDAMLLEMIARIVRFTNPTLVWFLLRFALSRFWQRGRGQAVD